MTTYFSDLMFFFVSNSRYALHNECFGQIPDKRGCAILYCFVILITIRQRSNNQHKMLIVKSSWRNFLYTILAYFRTSSDTLWIRKKESPLTLFKKFFYFLGKSSMYIRIFCVISKFQYKKVRILQNLRKLVQGFPK